MRVFKIFLFLTTLWAFSSSALAQEGTTGKEDFESYERNFSQVENKKPTAQKTPKVTKTPANPRTKQPVVKTSKSPDTKTTGQVKVKVPPANVGLPGMKIWVEKQVECEGEFSLVAPTSIFQTGDCVRTRFRSNFQGYLTVVNFGSSGSIETLFPAKNQSNKIAPKTDFFIPGNDGWEFYNEAGNENLFFIVSRSPLKGNFAQEIRRQRKIETENSDNLEVYDRDLRPRTEKNEVFVLAGEARLERPLIFRLTLKHRS